MIHIIVFLIVFCWGFLVAYFFRRYLGRKKPQSIVISVACLSPMVHLAREMHWIPRLPLNAIVAAYLVCGCLGVSVVLYSASQR